MHFLRITLCLCLYVVVAVHTSFHEQQEKYERRTCMIAKKENNRTNIRRQVGAVESRNEPINRSICANERKIKADVPTQMFFDGVFSISNM